MDNTYSIIILAAGASSRLGSPKQLLPYKQKPLLQHTIDEAKASAAQTVVLVLGAAANEIRPAIHTEGVQVTINEIWKEGMAASIRNGINTLQEINPDCDAAILMMCDQPYVTAALLNRLMDTHRKTRKPIVTSSFDRTTGPPTLFHQRIFPELLQLTGDKGARLVVETHAGNVVTVPFARGAIDIDTTSDYDQLTRNPSQ